MQCIIIIQQAKKIMQRTMIIQQAYNDYTLYIHYTASVQSLSSFYSHACITILSVPSHCPLRHCPARDNQQAQTRAAINSGSEIIYIFIHDISIYNILYIQTSRHRHEPQSNTRIQTLPRLPKETLSKRRFESLPRTGSAFRRAVVASASSRRAR